MIRWLLIVGVIGFGSGAIAGEADPEATTVWNKNPQVKRDADGTLHATSLKSFEGIEEPTMKVVAATGKAERDEFVNITEPEAGVVRMTLRYSAEGWDGDQGK